MELGNNLRKLRRNADITQEELAAFLGVTSQAVSKWECGDGYPEITLLPAIAARFKVTVDALLGTDKEPDHMKLSEINQRAARLVFEGHTDEGIALLRESIADHPTVYWQRTQLASIYQNIAAQIERDGGNDETRLSYLREAAAIYEYIMEYCNEPNELNTKLTAERNAYKLYYTLGEREKMMKQIGRVTPNLLENGIDLVTPDFAKGNDRVFAAQMAVMRLASALITMTLRLAENEYEPGPDITHDDIPGEGEWAYTPEERIRILEMGTELFDLVFGDDYTGFYLMLVRLNTEQVMRLALSLGDNESAMKALQKSANYMLRFDPDGSSNIASGRLMEAIRGVSRNEPLTDLRFLALEKVDPDTRALLLKPISSSLLLNHLTTININAGFNYTMGPNHSAIMLANLADNLYDPLRGDARFFEIEKLLRSYARTEGDAVSAEIMEHLQNKET